MFDRQHSPLWQLVISRVRLFLREPAALFWVYGFPILMMAALGTAFRDNPQETITVDLVGIPVESPVHQALAKDQRFKVVESAIADSTKRLQYGKTDLIVQADPQSADRPQFWEEPRRTESRLARYAVEAAIGRQQQSDTAIYEVQHLSTAGSRYIDFLLPGMLGMGLMGGGMWGVGFLVVDLRVRRLLKRFLATPMRQRDFLMSIMISRMVFSIIDILVLIAFGYFAFGVRSQGSTWQLLIVVLLGAVSFSGIGLLIASRARTLETVSGLMNLIILPMWVLSGVFFSSERFPEAMQPVINLLPLTALNQMLRGIMLEGATITSCWKQATLLTVYAVVTFTVALRIFRWK